jgi:hypothetical protein
VVGTYGVLARWVAEDRMDLKEGNALLRRMIAFGFRSHSDDLREETSRRVNTHELRCQTTCVRRAKD